MDIGHIPLFAAFSKRMAWLTARQTVLAENVANANTPGYMAKDLKELDFKNRINGRRLRGCRCRRCLGAQRP